MTVSTVLRLHISCITVGRFSKSADEPQTITPNSTSNYHTEWDIQHKPYLYGDQNVCKDIRYLTRHYNNDYEACVSLLANGKLVSTHPSFTPKFKQDPLFDNKDAWLRFDEWLCDNNMVANTYTLYSGKAGGFYHKKKPPRRPARSWSYDKLARFTFRRWVALCTCRYDGKCTFNVLIINVLIMYGMLSLE